MHAPQTTEPLLTLTAGSVDITPTQPVCLAGYAGRDTPYRDVAHSLEASAMVLRQGETQVVIVSVEALHLSDALMVHILARCPHLDRRSLWLAATHTHYAPALDESKPALGAVDPTHRAVVFDRIASLVEDLLARPATRVRMERHLGEANHAVNRRRQGWAVSRRGISRGVIMAPNLDAARDDRIQAVSFLDETGEVQAVLWSMTCHPVNAPDWLRIDPDYPGWVRRHLRRRGKAQLPVVFLQGFAGNVRPKVVRPRRHLLHRSLSAYARVNLLLNGSIFGALSESANATWAESLAQRVSAALAVGIPITPRLALALVEIPLSELAEGTASTDRVHLRALYLGPELVLVAVSAEPVVEYREHVERVFAPAQVVPIGYTDHVFGYLPTEQMVREGGYEASDFTKAFAFDGRLMPGCEARIEVGLKTLRDRFEPTQPVG